MVDFFRINLPYGFERNDKNEWFAFNHKYKPIGFATKERIKYEEYPIYSKYKGLTDRFIENLKPSQIEKDENGKISKFWLYNDETVPKSRYSNDKNTKLWDEYFSKSKKLSYLKRETN